MLEIEHHYPEDRPPAAKIDPARFTGTVASFEPECLTFDELVDRCRLERIDMVNIDVEGADWEVLRMIDLDRHQVSLVVVETAGTEDSDAIEAHLTGRGFRLRRT